MTALTLPALSEEGEAALRKLASICAHDLAVECCEGEPPSAWMADAEQMFVDHLADETLGVEVDTPAEAAEREWAA